MLIVPVGHPLTRMERVDAAQIAEYPLILPPRTPEHPGRARLEELFRQSRVEYRMVMESSNVELSSVYVEMGLGISFVTLAAGLPPPDRPDLAFIPLDHYFEPGYIAVVMRRNRELTPVKRAFLDVLVMDAG